MNCQLDVELHNLEQAQGWAEKLLAWSEQNGNQQWQFQSFHVLGNIALERRDFETAGKWYRQALAINEKQDNEHDAALTYGQLGILAGRQGCFEEAGKWLIKAILLFSKCNAVSDIEKAIGNFQIFYRQADPATRAKLKTMWADAALPPLKLTRKNLLIALRVSLSGVLLRWGQRLLKKP